MTTYKLAHLGCGWRGREHIGAIVKAGPRLQLVALCDKADEQRRLGAEKAGGDVALYDDAERMLLERRPDVFSFCTLPNLRWPLVELALRHGVRAIVVEKPMALSVGEARQMALATDRAGALLLVSHQHKYAAHWQAVREIIHQGRIGAIREIHATARGWLMQYATHLIDYATWLNGGSPPIRVAGHVSGREKLTDSHPSPDYAVGQIEYANGVRGTIECGSFAPSHAAGFNPPDPVDFWMDAGATVLGTEGFAQVLVGLGWRAITRDSGGQVIGSTETKFDGVADSIPFYQQIPAALDEPAAHPHPCRAEVALRGQETAIGICVSAIEHRVVDLPLANDPGDVWARLGEVLR